MASKWLHALVMIVAAGPIGAALAESDEDHLSEGRAVKLFMDGCVHFGPAPAKRPYWLRNEAQLLPVKIEARGILWASGPYDSTITVLNADDGLCSVVLAVSDATSLAPGLLKAFEKAGLPLQSISRQPPANLVANSRYRTIVEGLPFEVTVIVATPGDQSPQLGAVLAFKPSGR